MKTYPQRPMHEAHTQGGEFQHKTMEASRGKSCVLIQVDGLSYQNMLRAMAEGKLPYLKGLMDSKRAVLSPWRSMLPTSTGVFQTGLFYGANDDVPGFFWYDKRAEHSVRLNSVEGAYALETHVRGLVAPYPGLLKGGSAYSSLITGGAYNTLLTFSKLFNPSLHVPKGWSWRLRFWASQLMLAARIAYFASAEVVVALVDLIAALWKERNTYLELKFVVARIASVVLCREISTLASILDIHRGIGPIYMNHVSYDEHAHHRGPSSAFAFWSLKGVDSAIRRVGRAIEYARKNGIRDYDLYIWSDHGQVNTVPFQEVIQEEPEQHFNRLFLSFVGGDSDLGRRASARTRWIARVLRLRRKRRGHRPARARFNAAKGDHVADAFPWLARWLYKRLLMPAHLADASETAKNAEHTWPLAFISTGPVAHVYLKQVNEPVTFEMWNTLYPDFLRAIASHPGVGFALVRTEKGAAFIGHGGTWHNLEDAALLATLPAGLYPILRRRSKELIRWANMESAGDILLFGASGNDRPSVSYTYEWGGHAGPTQEETTPFLLAPVAAAALWPELTATPQQFITLADLHARLDAAYGTGAQRTSVDHAVQRRNV
ncbi:MAG: hypothetical protein IT366_01725 [Candidatus Hydrogenedentes bacterium]|nr:hypothetical protein [Candidatus Hydrogenedentota bacterium]